MNLHTSIGLLSLVFASGAVLPRGAFAAILTPVADSYVSQAAGSTGSNFGSASFLQLKNNTDTTDRKIYLRFDLSSLGTLTAGSLTLTVSNATGTAAATLGGARSYQLFGLTTESAWSEAGITWDNAPANDAAGTFTSAATLFETSNAASGASTVSFTFGQATLDFLNDDVDGMVTLMLFRTNNNATVDNFFSRESAFAAAALNVVPEPGSLLLLAAGACLVVISRRRKSVG